MLTSVKFKFHFWLKKYHLHAISVIGLLLIGMGVYQIYQYYNPIAYSFEPALGGFGYSTNATDITPTHFNVVIYANTNPTSLYFQFGFTSNKSGTYNFVFQFPFHLENKTNYQQFPISTNEAGSAIWFQCKINESSTIQEVVGYLSMGKTFQSGSRGSYIMTLPFAGYVNSQIVGQQFEDNLSWCTLENINLYVVLPFNSHITQSFPSFSTGPTHLPPDSYFDNSSLSRVAWMNVTLNNDITVMYEDQNESSNYANLLFYSGIFLGTGVSLTTTVAYDALKKHYDTEPDYE